MRKWPTLFSGAVLRSSTSTLRSSERSVERAESVRRMASKTQAPRVDRGGIERKSRKNPGK